MYSWKTVDGEVELLKISTWRTRLFDLAVHLPFIDGTLFDSGFPRARPWLAQALDGKRVERVINTHAHEDHLGNNAWLAARGAKLFAPQLSLPTARARARFPFYRRFIWGVPDPCAPEAVGNELRTARFRFQVVPVPGHIADMVAYFEPERGWLIGGDLFLGERLKVSGAWEDGDAWIASLERAAALRPRIYFCYHLGAIFDPARAFARKLEFLRELRANTCRLARQGLTPAQIRARLLGSESWLLQVLSQGEFSKENLVRSFLK